MEDHLPELVELQNLPYLLVLVLLGPSLGVSNAIDPPARIADRASVSAVFFFKVDLLSRFVLWTKGYGRRLRCMQSQKHW